ASRAVRLGCDIPRYYQRRLHCFRMDYRSVESSNFSNVRKPAIPITIPDFVEPGVVRGASDPAQPTPSLPSILKGTPHCTLLLLSFNSGRPDCLDSLHTPTS